MNFIIIIMRSVIISGYYPITTYDPKNIKKYNLCKDCKYFVKQKNNENLLYGLCTRFGNINLINGSISYDYASTTRQFTCKDEYFEEAQAQPNKE